MNRLFYPLFLLGAVLIGFAGGTYLFSSPGNGPGSMAGQGSGGGQGVVIVQNPDLSTILNGPGTYSLSKSNIQTWSSDTELEFSDDSPEKTGVVLWVFRNIPATQSYRFRLKVAQGAAGASWSEFRITFRAAASSVAQYSFAFHQGSGKIIPQKKASREMVKVSQDGAYWVFELQGSSLAQKSRMLVELLPVIGKPPKTGTLSIQSINIIKV